MSPDVSSSLSTHFPCHWNWCTSVFITKTQLLAHLDEQHFSNWKPVKRMDLEARKRRDMEPEISVNLTLSPINPRTTQKSDQPESNDSERSINAGPDLQYSINDPGMVAEQRDDMSSITEPLQPPPSPQVQPPSSPIIAPEDPASLEPQLLPVISSAEKSFKFGSLASDATPSPSPLPPSPTPSMLIHGITAQTVPRSSSWALAPPLAAPTSPSPKKSIKRPTRFVDVDEGDENDVQRPPAKRRTGNTPAPYSPVSTRLRAPSPSVGNGNSPPTHPSMRNTRSRSVTPSTSSRYIPPSSRTPKRQSKAKSTATSASQSVLDKETLSLKELHLDTNAAIPEEAGENVDELDDESLNYAPLAPPRRKAGTEESFDSASLGAFDESMEGISDTSMNFATQAPISGTFDSQSSG